MNSVTVAEYIYDGDGNQVRTIVYDGDLTIDTVYIGMYYQQTTTTDASVSPATVTTSWEKYYYAGTVRLAMREDSDTPLYIITDHLSSTSLVVDTSGAVVAKRTYLPFGETWGNSATDLPTDYTYTGQREADEIGLSYYVARLYDRDIASFLQADTVVPGAGNPVAYNRYSYTELTVDQCLEPTITRQKPGFGFSLIRIIIFGQVGNWGIYKSSTCCDQEMFNRRKCHEYL